VRGSHAASGDARPVREPQPGPVTSGNGRGPLPRWRRRRTGHVRRLNRGKRRMLVGWLRRTADREPSGDPNRRRREVLLPGRVAVARNHLHDIADMLEHTTDVDSRWVADLRALLGNGCESPLYNAEVHISELEATLYYLRSGLATRALSTERGRTGRCDELSSHGA
jgi:hypothetical protein